MCYWVVRWKAYNVFVILSPEFLEQTLINLTAIEVVPPPPIYLRSKAWSGLITKQVINAVSALAMKCIVNGINGLFPENDNVSANSKPDHHPRATPEDSDVLTGWGVGILNQRNFLRFSKTSAGTSRFVSGVLVLFHVNFCKNSRCLHVYCR